MIEALGLLQNRYECMKHLLIACLIAITFSLAPFAAFASTTDLSPKITALSKNFSQKFCTSIGVGMTPEKAGETAATQLSKGLLFSPLMTEIMSASKEDLAASLSQNIFEECGNELGGTKEELNTYLSQLANKVPSKSSNGLQLPPTRQKPSQ
ncbi:hypothetical protein [Prochlorococcus marinus]|uniref:hypothetical protein n=1 Tax=Prochlorococcus marinus TaxID=1219 RepID=UPI0022B36B93|nr:hypothetical protein [Prochlorococcus marinus]